MLRPLLPDHPLRRLVARFVWQPDQWIRMATALSLAGDPRTVLDVGGRGRQMQALSRARVTTVNVEEPADVVVSRGVPLPFADRSFDVVTACDVLEHLPGSERTRFLRELVRVAARRVVLCFPHGSARTNEMEKAFRHRIMQEFGVRLPYLEEHVEMGLPETGSVIDQLRTFAPDGEVECWWSHDRRRWDDSLLEALRARHRLDLRALLRFGRVWFGSRRTAELHRQPGLDPHRAYVVVTLADVPTRR